MICKHKDEERNYNTVSDDNLINGDISWGQSDKFEQSINV